ncbi:MAG: hypothetical protein IJU35_02300 [Paludibacteraceae bacterium]|nr:hypothetical protein [Paludibacteraceae bacterium]
MLEILKYTLPSAIVLLAAYLVLHKQMKDEDRRRTFMLRRESLGVITPIRLRAYERLALVLDRTQPEQMLLNIDLTNLNCLQLQGMLLKNIRQEFDHNAAQQIYVSGELWANINATKESMLGLVNTCAAYVKPEEPAIKLAEILIQTYHNNGETATERANLVLRAEVQQLF